MRTPSMRTLPVALAAAIALVGTAAATPATDRAEAQCLIGERTDGYLGVVDGKSIDAALRREMDEVNQARSAAYERLARKNGVSKAAAAAATAERLINTAPSGQCVQTPDGSWVKVP